MKSQKTVLKQLNRSLLILQERKAQWVGYAPLELLTQIEDHKIAIQLTERSMVGELSEVDWRESIKPLLIKLEKSSSETTTSVTIGDIEGNMHDSMIAGRDIIIQKDPVSLDKGAEPLVKPPSEEE